MSKEITKSNILVELTDKFGLRDYEREDFLFSEFVLPTYDIGAHTKKWEIARHRKPVGANGVFEFFVVPANEEWRVRRLTLIHETGANFDIDQLYHYNFKVATDINYLFYDTTAPITTGKVKIFEFPADIPMAYQDRLIANVSNYVAGGYISLHILREVTVIR